MFFLLSIYTCIYVWVYLHNIVFSAQIWVLNHPQGYKLNNIYSFEYLITSSASVEQVVYIMGKA